MKVKESIVNVGRLVSKCPMEETSGSDSGDEFLREELGALVDVLVDRAEADAVTLAAWESTRSDAGSPMAKPITMLDHVWAYVDTEDETLKFLNLLSVASPMNRVDVVPKIHPPGVLGAEG
ncbi:hypothetical protein DACRYDRAFT_19103 [Dacryopinax primogenitus]|uniref:Uncharacterized protein n=1 Tax=Dacryopinax primogenitus (strain DJM 731) TaxID=1858805 RepID=M5FP43_DACPD|nr:uncharacterized protein DACRYDRAFT_19103 [Dacryopinax primogenitus]EJT96803.1 hypothetical protein DACRYDRAFT_19103 [Dacryopinax primogenitus]